MSRLKSYLRLTAAATVAAVVGALMPQSCTCSHHRGGDASGTASADTVVAREPEAILNGPAELDPQALRQYAGAVGGNVSLSEADMAQMTRLCEAAVSRIEAETEQLGRNDDAADTWNVLQEFARQPWVADERTVATFLETVPLRPLLQERVDQLTRTRARLNTVLRELCHRQLHRQPLLEV